MHSLQAVAGLGILSSVKLALAAPCFLNGLRKTFKVLKLKWQFDFHSFLAPLLSLLYQLQKGPALTHVSY